MLTAGSSTRADNANGSYPTDTTQVWYADHGSVLSHEASSVSDFLFPVRQGIWSLRGRQCGAAASEHYKGEEQCKDSLKHIWPLCMTFGLVLFYLRLWRLPCKANAAIGEQKKRAHSASAPLRESLLFCSLF